MKSLSCALAFVIFCFTFTASGQTYHYFPDSCAIWNTIGDNSITGDDHEFRYGLYGDTIINSLTYSKVYSLYDTSLINPNSTYFGAIREDENKRVHFIMPGFEETILYDFTAEVGDNIWYPIGGYLCGDGFEFWPESPHYLTVTMVDSMLLDNGEYRKRWQLSGEIMWDTWVEGIGSISWFGLFNPLISDIALCGDWYSFACFRQDYETIYLENELCEDCYCDIVLSYPDHFIDRDHALSITPNPAEGELVVDAGNIGRYYRIRILDMTGREVLRMTDLHEGKTKVPVAALQPGIYILTLIDNQDDLIASGKVVVK